MQKFMGGVVVAAMVLGTAGVAGATDVVNQDNKGYTLTIIAGSITETKKIAAGGTFYGLCGADQCTFKIPGSQIVAGKNDRITIRDGKFTKN